MKLILISLFHKNVRRLHLFLHRNTHEKYCDGKPIFYSLRKLIYPLIKFLTDVEYQLVMSFIKIKSNRTHKSDQ